jgi:VWFA-related protein
MQNAAELRSRRPLTLEACVLTLALVLPATAFPQSPASADVPAAPSITTTSTLVIVPALVRDSSGQLLHALHASDFQLTDNGVPQHVSLEDIEHQPLSVVVLLQTGGAAQRQFASYAKLGTMLTYIVGDSPHHVALVTFDSQPEYLWDFTKNIADLEDGFTQPDPGDGGAAILDAVNQGIDLLKQQPPEARRILIVVSQAHDEGSRARAEDIVRSLGENNITIECFTFSPEKAWLKDQFTKPRHENAPYQMSPDHPPIMGTFDIGTPLGMALKAMRTDTSANLARLSGGESLPFGSQTGLEQQFALLANHLASSYTLSFSPSSKQPGFHSLQLRISGQPRLQISARNSYWAAEPAATK